MSTVEFHRPENRLAKALAAPGGKRVSEAVASAEAGLLSTSDACVAEIDQALEELRALGPQAIDRGEAEALYIRARKIVGLGALGGLQDLGDAALLFCTLLDRAMSDAPIRSSHAQPYFDAMALLRRPDAFAPEQRRALLDQLGSISDRFPRPQANEKQIQIP